MSGYLTGINRAQRDALAQLPMDDDSELDLSRSPMAGVLEYTIWTGDHEDATAGGTITPAGDVRDELREIA